MDACRVMYRLRNKKKTFILTLVLIAMKPIQNLLPTTYVVDLNLIITKGQESSMIHSARPTVQPSSDHYSHFNVVLFCEILKSVRTDDMSENSDHYRP